MIYIFDLFQTYFQIYSTRRRESEYLVQHDIKLVIPLAITLTKGLDALLQAL